jgi:hypothetical protein
MGIKRYTPWIESEKLVNFRKQLQELISKGEKPIVDESILKEVNKKSDHEQNWKKDVEDKWYKWHRESPDLNGLWTVAAETRKWLEDNVIYLEGDICES